VDHQIDGRVFDSAPVCAGAQKQVSDASTLTDQSVGGLTSDDLPTLDKTSTFVVRAPGMQDDHLRLRAVGHVLDRVEKSLLVLVDTGAQISLIRTGLIPDELFETAGKPVHLMTASQQPLRGGKRIVKLELIFSGFCEKSGEAVTVKAPCHLFEADISDDVIVSYTWLGERGIDVSPRRHGILCQDGTTRVWVPGIPAPDANPPVVPLMIRRTSTKPKYALDLFSGTGSAGSVLQAHGFQVVSVDVDPKWKPTHQVDVMTWDYAAAYVPGHFDIVVAAPPCTEFSRALTTRARCLDQALRLVKKALEIVEYFRPATWWLETPAHGVLAKSEFMAGFPYVDCDQCQFSDYGYQKPTRLFGTEHL
jgi:hypothetical protein